MALKRISDSILYVGADDRTIDLFENQYPVSNGMGMLCRKRQDIRSYEKAQDF